jgi:predicted nucleic acid-binding protein
MFWDASALVPILVDELRSFEVAALLEDDPLPMAWWATPVECASALHRRAREGKLKRDALDQALGRLRALSTGMTFVMPTEEVRTRATTLLPLHSLRAADALQLAAALVSVEGLPAGEPFVCLDKRLRESAHLQGFSVRPSDGLPLIAHDTPRRGPARRRPQASKARARLR